MKNNNQMITSLKEFKKQRGFKNSVLESLGIDEEDADFLPAPTEMENELDAEGESEELTFDQFKEGVIAEHERLTSEMEEGEECCELPTDEQLELVFTVHQNLANEVPGEMEEEDLGDDNGEFIDDEVEPVEEIFGKKSKKRAYQNTVEFVEGDSEEAKKAKELYEKHLKGKDDSEIRKDRNLLKIMQHITKLGAKWAKENKMEPKDYSFKQIRTVLEGDYDRAFTGGTDVTVGESKEEDKKTEPVKESKKK